MLQNQSADSPNPNPNAAAHKLIQKPIEEAQFGGFEYVRGKDKLVVVGLKIFYPKYGRSAILDAKMRDQGGYWQLTRICQREGISEAG